MTDCCVAYTDHMIDCHSHFYFPQFPEEDIPFLASAATAAGVKAIVVVPESLQDCQQVLQLSKQQPLAHPCAGLHPVQPLHGPGPEQFYSSCRSVQDVSEVQPVLEFIRTHADELVALGEVGLDFTPHVLQAPCSNQDPTAVQACSASSSSTQSPPSPDTLKEVQQAVFQQQIQLANDLNLPLNVHSRSAGHYAVDALIAGGARAALLHAFDGRHVHALKGAAAGFYFSVPPSIVRSPQKQKMVEKLPLDNLVLETDAPALGPDKDVTNVPANLTISAREIARLKNIPVEQVVQITTENALKLFVRLAERGMMAES